MNYLAIFLAACAVMVLGSVWYGPWLFGTAWRKLMGYKMRDMKEIQQDAWKGYLSMIVGLLVTAYMLSRLMTEMDISTFVEAVELGFWLRIGLIVPTFVGLTFRESRKTGLLWLSIGYQLISLLVMITILLYV